MNVDEMVVMMSLMDTDGNGQVTKSTFGAYYKRLKACSDAEFDSAWRQIDTNCDGVLSLNELCQYYSIPCGECASALAAQKEMDDEKILEALQLQALLNEARLKEEQQKKAHAERLRALAVLADEVSDDEDASSPTVVTKARAASPLTMQDIIRQSKLRGELAPHHYEK